VATCNYQRFDKLEKTLHAVAWRSHQLLVLRLLSQQLRQPSSCGLEGILNLPQLVVCGDQSAGKSSVLEALTEIPFPKNDNLCTRFATEIILRRASANSITIKVIPDEKRPTVEQAKINTFKETIVDFDNLPKIMDVAIEVMGLSPNANSNAPPRAFARDVLSIEIEGPSRPQLTLVDIPGLISTHTKNTTKEDIALVASITEHYISSPRTICLAVVAAVTDYANQKILERVREHDKNGDRTLGIITKPDMAPKGSGLEKSYIDLAKGEDIQLRLGWHVVKNRKVSICLLCTSSIIILIWESLLVRRKRFYTS